MWRLEMPALAAANDLAPERPPPAAAPRLKLALERAEDREPVSELMARAFGPGRFAKTAERLREGATLQAACSWCAWHGGELVGAVRTWPVWIGATRALFLGPIAVSDAWRRQGLGALLVERACEASYAADARLVLLVGARTFFEPLGFAAVEPGRVLMPGPVDPRRLLWRELEPGAGEGVGGPVSPRLRARELRP